MRKFAIFCLLILSAVATTGCDLPKILGRIEALSVGSNGFSVGFYERKDDSTGGETGVMDFIRAMSAVAPIFAGFVD